MTAADQFWAATEAAAPEPESTTVTHVYRFTPDEFAARLGIPVPEGARIINVQHQPKKFDSEGPYANAVVKVTVENKLERKP